MCTRVAIPDSIEVEKCWPAIGHKDQYPARYNVAPGATVPIIARTAEGTRFIAAHWGFKRPSGSTLADSVTAQSEDAATSPAWAESFRTGRCLVPALGWYEWKGDGGEGSAQPHFTRRVDGELLFFAALIKDASVPSFVILTRAATSSTAERLPLVLRPDNYASWLGEGISGNDRMPSVASEALEDALLEAVPVKPLVDDLEKDGPELVEAIQLWPHPPTGTREMAKRPESPIG